MPELSLIMHMACKGKMRTLQKWLDEDSDRISDAIDACCIV